MSWSYSGDPAASPLDEVRWLVADTDKRDQQVQDKEIEFTLAKQPETKLAAALVCEHLARRFSRLATFRVGDVSENLSDVAQAYRDRADELRAEAGILAEPSFGGLSKSEKRNLARDTDAVQPAFRVGMDDNPGAPHNREGDTQFFGRLFEED